MEPDPGNDTIRDRGQQMTSRAPAAKPSKLQHSRSRHQALQSQPCGLQHTDQRVTSAIGCGKRARTMISPFMEVAASHDIRDPPVSLDDSSTATVLGCTAAEQGGAARCRLSAVNSGMEECRSLPTELCSSSITSQWQLSPLQQQFQQQPQQPERLVLGSPFGVTSAAAAEAFPRSMARSCSDTPPMVFSSTCSAQHLVLDLQQQQQHQQQRQASYAAVSEAVGPTSNGNPAGAADGVTAAEGTPVAAASSVSLRHRYLSPLAALPTQQLRQLLLNIDGQIRQRQEASCRPEAGPADIPEAQHKLRTLIKLRSQVSRQLLARHKQMGTAQPPAAAAAASGASADAAEMAHNGCALQQYPAPGHEQTQRQTQVWQQRQQQCGHQHAEQQQHQQQPLRVLLQQMQPQSNFQLASMSSAVLGQEQQQLSLLHTYCQQQQQQQQDPLHPALATDLPALVAADWRNSSSTTASMCTSTITHAHLQACSAGTATAAAGCDPASSAAAAAALDIAGSTHDTTRLCKRKTSDSLAIWGCYQGLSVGDIPPGWHSNVLWGLEEAVPQGVVCPMLVDQTVASSCPELEPVMQLDQEQVQVQVSQDASSRFSSNASPGSRSPAPPAAPTAGIPSLPTRAPTAAAAAFTSNNILVNSPAAAAAGIAIPATTQTLSSGSTATHSNKPQPLYSFSAVSGGSGLSAHPATAAAALEVEAALPALSDSDPFISVDDFLDGLWDLEALAATPPPQDPQTSMSQQNPEALGWQQQQQQQQYKPGSSSSGVGALDHLWSDHSHAAVLSHHHGAAAAAAISTSPPPVPQSLPAAAALTGRAPLPHDAMAFNREQQQVEGHHQPRSPFALAQLRQKQQRQQQQVAEGRLLLDQQQQQHQQHKLHSAHPRWNASQQQGTSDQLVSGQVPTFHPAGAVADTSTATVAPVAGPRNILEAATTWPTQWLHPYQQQQQQQQQHYSAGQWADPSVYSNLPLLPAWTHQAAAQDQLPQVWEEAQKREQQQTHMMQPFCPEPFCPRPLSLATKQFTPAASGGYSMGHVSDDAGSGSNDQQQKGPGSEERCQHRSEQQQQWQQYFRKSKLPPVGSLKYKRLQQVWAVIKARDLVKQLPPEAVTMMAQLENSSTAAATLGMDWQQKQRKQLAAYLSLAPPSSGGRRTSQTEDGSGCLMSPQAAAAAATAAGAAASAGTASSEQARTASGELTVAIGLLRAHSNTYSQDAAAAAAEAAHLQASPQHQPFRSNSSLHAPRSLAPPLATTATAAMQMCQANIHVMSPGSGRWLHPAFNELAVARVPSSTPETAGVGPPQTSLTATCEPHKTQQPLKPYFPATASSPSSSSALAPLAAAAGPVAAHSQVSALAGGPLTSQVPAAAPTGDLSAVFSACKPPFMRAFGSAAALGSDLATLDDEDTSWLEDLDADWDGAQRSLPMLPLTVSTEIAALSGIM